MKPVSQTINLNPQQQEAVDYPAQPLLVLAGAGTGKTRVLTHRIARFIDRGETPESVLAVTFTNKAAGEMKERILRLVGERARYCWIGTFHSICARILRGDCRRLGYGPNFTIYDGDDQKRLVKKAIRDVGLSDKQVAVGGALACIRNAKNRLQWPGDLDPSELDDIAGNHWRIYGRYQDELKRANAFDFDDLIGMTVRLLREFPEIQSQYRERFIHVLVDEYQDTNIAQYQWLHTLTGGRGSVTVVGDDDQSIYGWRGAHVENLLGFEEHFPGAHVCRLEQNYRSTPQILQMANSVIAHNHGRKGKTLWTRINDGDRVGVYSVEDELAEAEALAQILEKVKPDELQESCILYRTNAQSRALEDALRLRAIPYVIIGGIRFYERKEIKDILAYLHLIVNPDDNLSFLRAVTVPKRGIGERTLGRLGEFAQETGDSLLVAAGKAGQIGTIAASAGERLREFHGLLASFSKEATQTQAWQVMETVLERSGILEAWSDESGEDAEDRRNNLREFVRAGEAYCRRVEEPSLLGFLQEVSLISDIDAWDPNKAAVSLMTVHCAKGLEFSNVYITGLEQGLFPILRNMETQDLLEEERRLFYVAATRARRRLSLYYARNRRRFGAEMTGRRSMFIDEMDGNAVDRTDLEISVPKEPLSRDFAPASQTMPEYENFSQEPRFFQVGTYVRHPSWGNGKVLAIRGMGPDAKLTIAFGGVQKKVIARYANLDIL